MRGIFYIKKYLSSIKFVLELERNFYGKYFMRILGIETSCDETAASVVEDGTGVLSNITPRRSPARKPAARPQVAARNTF